MNSKIRTYPEIFIKKEESHVVSAQVKTRKQSWA